MNGIVSWFARNGVAANLLAVFIILAGIFSLSNLKREIFPEVNSELISVTVPYPGAAPEEVEEGICIRIEEAIQGLEDVKKISSTAQEGVGVVLVQLFPGSDMAKNLDTIKARVDAIDTFPEIAEVPVIEEIVLRKQVVNIALAAAMEERVLKNLGERVRDELTSLPQITQVELANVRPYEISIEVSESALKQFGLTFDQVANAVRRSSLDLPGGSVKTKSGEILLRTKGQAYRGSEFENLLLLAGPDGSRVRLGDVATVVDGFAESDVKARFDGMNSVMVQVFRVGDQNALDISEAVARYTEDLKERLPREIIVTTWQDDTSYLRGRQELLIKNGLAGLVLVFATLALFLRLSLAFWVSFGLIVSFLGTFWVMPYLDVSINLLSLFAFILVLGIVVDDAIVVSENIHSHQEQHEGDMEAAVRGCQEVSKPVIFAVLTTIAAFMPLVMVPGTTGKIMKVIPYVVIPTLVFSLIESLLILPNHLSHTHISSQRGKSWWSRLSDGFTDWIEWFIKNIYRPVLERALHWRYFTLASCLAMLILTLGLVSGGWIRFQFFPPVEGDNVAAILTMPLGTPEAVTEQAVARLEASAEQLRKEIEQEQEPGTPSVFRHVLASIGQQPFLKTQREGAGNFVQAFSNSHLGEVHIELVASEQRGNISSIKMANRWRELTGEIPGAVELLFTANIFSSGDPIHLQLSGNRYETLRKAADALKNQLALYTGVTDIRDSFREGKEEVHLGIEPSAQALGLSLSDLGRQVRQGFYGEEAQRIQRGRDEVKVMVRYPEEDRRSLGNLEQMRIRFPDGRDLPFSSVATAELGRGYASIERVNRSRVIQVTADVDVTQANAQEVIARLKTEFLDHLSANFPGVRYSWEGEQQEQQETMQGILQGYPLALLMIYALLAIPFRSYLQPFIVMSAIPFGLVGAVWGHVFMGMDLTILSMFGIVALSGVVVNDNLVLVVFINRFREKGGALWEAVREAGVVRFRPILLTSLTTFVGLIPLILEKSVQAKFLIPMAISLAFGVMFATLISLLLVPSLYLILEDLRRAFGIGAKKEEFV